MSSLKINLRSGAASLAQFVGIGKGIAPAAAHTSRSFVAIGGSPSARAKGNRAEDPDNQEDAPPAHDPDDDGDDDALEDDDYGADAPNSDDAPEEADAKRARRVARKARRMKAVDDDAGKGDDDAPPPPPPQDDDNDAEDPDAEMRGNSPVAKARRKERARCATIFSHEAAAENLDLAAHLAFNTSMARGEAIATLARGGAPQGGILAGAMRGYAGQRPGNPPAPEKPKAQQIAASWDVAFDDVTAYRGKK